jgi:opacity protein-like surface antigen
MRFIKLGTLAAFSVLVSATAVYAGDAQHNWNGFYVGGNFGAGWSGTEPNEGAGTALQPQFSSHPASETGAAGQVVGRHSGFQAGYNRQIPNSPFVLGIEGGQSR